MNILILAAGTRNKIVQYFKKNIDGKVIAADASILAPAIYEADKYYIVPKITDPEYIDRVLEICDREQVVGVLSLIDPELSLLAFNSQKFKEHGVTVIGSSLELCEMSLDKFKMYQWLISHGYKCACSWMDIDSFEQDLVAGKASLPVFVKPVRGSASVDIGMVNSLKELQAMKLSDDNLLIQEYLAGQEIGADVYIDMVSSEIVSIFTKKKIRMRSGETDKAVSFKDEKLFRLIDRFVAEAGYSGQIDIDIFEINGEYYISEVNPRFGGGYPHAYECGCNHMELIANNLRGYANPKNIGNYEDGIYMMKYNEIKVIRPGGKANGE